METKIRDQINKNIRKNKIVLIVCINKLIPFQVKVWVVWQGKHQIIEILLTKAFYTIELFAKQFLK